jgi:gluconolactonase
MRGRKTFAFDIEPDGSLTNKRLLCEQGSDGMTLDEAGNLYLTGGGVSVYDKTGKLVERLSVPEGTANVCFGGKDRKTLFITARTGLYAIQAKNRGANFNK